ncbi:hypothetical protein J41TS4_37800 [Paenibacillus apis]|uniref:Uncharacterized protein n=1 Tax=Paenibacillus apis TaxID=1792174 RepID=A0A920CPA6_9BACL|nr:hypothetical protein J41TS4_37800 [Paenibacillus apis]
MSAFLGFGDYDWLNYCPNEDKRSSYRSFSIMLHLGHGKKAISIKKDVQKVVFPGRSCSRSGFDIES